MDLSSQQQSATLLKKAKTILIALPATMTIDIICAACGLRDFLQKLGVSVTLASGGMPPEGLNFLQNPLGIVSELGSNGPSTITLNTTHATLDELSYTVEATKVQILLKPKNGIFFQEDVVFTSGIIQYDAIVILGSPSVEALGVLYDHNTELFFNTPKINIDIQPTNDYFGTINIIDITAVAVSEIVARLIEYINIKAIDEMVATSLLGGLIAATKSFQQANTTPQSLLLGASLLTKGANKEEIVRSLYKTKDYQLLKVWGRALARLKIIESSRLYYSILTPQDFSATQFAVEKLPLVLHEVLDTATDMQVVGLLAEYVLGTVRVTIASLPHIALGTIFQALGSSVPTILKYGTYVYGFVDLSETPMSDIEPKFIEAVKSVVRL